MCIVYCDNSNCGSCSIGEITESLNRGYASLAFWPKWTVGCWAVMLMLWHLHSPLLLPSGTLSFPYMMCLPTARAVVLYLHNAQGTWPPSVALWTTTKEREVVRWVALFWTSWRHEGWNVLSPATKGSSVLRSTGQSLSTLALPPWLNEHLNYFPTLEWTYFPCFFFIFSKLTGLLKSRDASWGESGLCSVKPVSVILSDISSSPLWSCSY